MSRASSLPPASDRDEPYQQLLRLPQHEQTVAKLRELVEADYYRRLDLATDPAARAALSLLNLSCSRRPS
jgi:hypothetical protein